MLALILHLKKVAKIRRLSCGQFLEHVGASASSSDHNQMSLTKCSVCHDLETKR